MTVDAECSVAISSLSEGECSMTTTTGTSSTSNTDNTAAIIGGVVVVAVVFIIALTVLIFGIVALVLKSRRREFSIRKAEE